MTTPTVPEGDLGSAAAIRIVAGREVRGRLASKGYRWTTFAFIVVVVLAGVALKLIQGSQSPEQIAVTAQTAGATAQIEAAAAATGVEVEVRTVTERAMAEEQLRSGDLAVVVTSISPTLTIVVKESVPLSLEPMFGALAQQLALVQAVEQLGGDPVAVTAQVAGAAPQIQSLEPTPPVDAGQIVAAYATGILLFLALMTAGQLVAQGVVEEKSSRVVELLLATLRPTQLMAGKVLGIGVMGVLQMVLVVVAATATATATGLLDTTSLDLGSTAVWAIVWFIIGFATYALILAALASLVSRQEDVGAVIAPVTVIMAIPYIVGVSIAPFDPDNPLVVWLSYLPMCAPLIMPIRIAVGGAEAWEVALALGLSLALIPILVLLAARIYSNSVLHSGARVSLREAMRRR